MKELYFIRHGQTEWNAIRRAQGQLNSDLNDLGRRQAEVNGEFLKHRNIDYMVASPLDRTRQTAEIIDKHLGLGFDFDERIKEWHCGDWSGEMWDEIPAKWPNEYTTWQSNRFNNRAPGAENYPDMIERSEPFLNHVLENNHERVAIVSHGLIGRVMIGELLSLPPSDMLSFSQANDAIIHVIKSSNGFTVQHFNAGQGPIMGLPPYVH